MSDFDSTAHSLTHGLAPIAGPGVQTLVLGSLPSRLSIERQEYYGNPQNAFWRIMGQLAGAGPELPYAARTARLLDAGIGLWDVLRASVRPGSLDADIDPATAVPNDLAGFLGRYPGIGCIGFNGRKARELFDKKLLPAMREQVDEIALVDLPSTSPAHAAMSFEDKLSRWSRFLEAA